MYSSDDDDHNYVIDSPSISDNVITINIKEHDATSFIVSVIDSNNAVAIAID
jgi:transcription antitermination factor NusA-like protein